MQAGHRTLLYSSFFRPGFWGVTLFFSISGFLIIGQLLDIASGSRNESLRVFVLRRCLRTLPTYWLVTVLVLLAGLVAWPGGSVLAFNLLLVQSVAGVGSVLPVAWSLVIEVWSYLMFASLAWVSRFLVAHDWWLQRSLPRIFPREVFVICSLIVLPLLASCIRFDWSVHGASVQQLKQGLAPQLDALVYGGMLAWLQRWCPPFFERLARSLWLMPLCLVLMSLVTATVPFLFANVDQPVPLESTVWLAFGFYPCVGLLASLLLLSLWRFRYESLPLRLDQFCRWLSRCSYSVYLLHLSVVALIAPLGAGFLAFLAYLFCSIVCGSIGWRFLERPFTRLRYVL